MSAIRVLVAHVMLTRTALIRGERRYCTAAQVPKATIQAVFGAYPLTVFLERCSDQPDAEIG